MMKRLLAAVFVFALSCGAAFAQTVAQTTNSSVVIAAGNTFQTVLTAVTSNNQRRSLTIQNNNAADSCWIYVGAGSPTKGTAILLLAGGSYTRYYPYVPSDPIQATCATTSDTLYIDTQ
jgi:curli biogenesis system outer membrane secretion channel CsgG